MNPARKRWLKVVVGTYLLLACMAVMFKGDYSSILERHVQQEPAGLSITIDQFAPPNTDPKAQPDFDIWAWNSFIALNWPALSPNESNNYLRGIPNVNKSFANAAPDDTLVWETFKEKREVFNQFIEFEGAYTTEPTLYPWNHPIDYGPLRPADLDTTHRPFAMGRVMHQANKQNQTYNAFDETAEVGSEALEEFYPDGRTPNEVYGHPVGPRVWRGKPSDRNPVVYEVKLNYDYYEYVKQNKLYTDDTARIDSLARAAQLRLPYRTSSTRGPKGQIATTNYPLATSYSAEATSKVYERYNQNPDGKTQMPPFVGAMQFKAAWVELDPNTDDISKFHHTKATYYVSDAAGNPQPVLATFGLIGLHIIQRIHVDDEAADANSTGGTFIFATWEHTSIRNDIGDNGLTKYTYSNYYNPAVDPAPIVRPGNDTLPQGFYPPLNRNLDLDGAYPVPRKFRILSNPGNPSAPATKEVNEMVHNMLPENSVWRNYQLVGTQFIAVNVNSASIQVAAGKTPRYPVTLNDPQGIGLPVYLANLVVETNAGLQKFQGQPPVTKTIDNYLGAGLDANLTAQFQRDNTNTIFNRQPSNMGGCMGCHGVAQSRGFSFSFVLLGGRDGGKTDTQTHFEIPPLDSLTRNE